MISERARRNQELILSQFKALNPFAQTRETLPFLTQSVQGGVNLPRPIPPQSATIQELPSSVPQLNWDAVLEPRPKN